MKRFIFLFFLAFSTSLFSQQRIGIEIGTRFENLNFTVHYQKVYKEKFIWSAGIFVGSYGSTYVEYKTSILYIGNRVDSPYDNVDHDFQDTSGNYHLITYDNTGRSIGVQLGLGYFHVFSVVHGIRFNLNAKIGYSGVETSAWYHSIINYGNVRMIKYNTHLTSCVSPELYHTIRIGGRSTFYYGVRLPYYFSLDKANFNPQVDKDLFYGLEPELASGVTWQIGKCN